MEGGVIIAGGRRMCGYVDLWMCGFVDLWMCGFVDAWMCGFVDVWICGCVDLWMRGFVDLWMCGCVDVWICGCVYVWMCGWICCNKGRKYKEMEGNMKNARKNVRNRIKFRFLIVDPTYFPQCRLMTAEGRRVATNAPSI